MTIAKYNAPVRATAAGTVTSSARYSSPGVNSNLVKVEGDRNIASIVHTGSSGSGLYTITFDEVGEHLKSFDLGVLNTASTAAGQKTVNAGAYNAAAKTLTLVVVSCANPPALIDFANNDQLTVRVEWADSDAP